jgi:hypothetical protein
MVFGIAKRGFGMLKKSKKPKISEQLKVFKKASEKSKITQTNKKTMRTLGEMVNNMVLFMISSLLVLLLVPLILKMIFH